MDSVLYLSICTRASHSQRKRLIKISKSPASNRGCSNFSIQENCSLASNDLHSQENAFALNIYVNGFPPYFTESLLSMFLWSPGVFIDVSTFTSNTRPISFTCRDLSALESFLYCSTLILGFRYHKGLLFLTYPAAQFLRVKMTPRSLWDFTKKQSDLEKFRS